MSRVITFSRTYPDYHSKKGQPTHFIEKINRSLGMEHGIPFGDLTEKHFKDQGIEYSHKIYCDCIPKYHTIREGHKWKVGDKFSPRVWGTDINPKSKRSGPYQSKQIIVAPTLTVEKIWKFKLKSDCFILNGIEYGVDGEDSEGLINEIAENDGLDQNDLMEWFRYPKPFDGQIICWDKNINY